MPGIQERIQELHKRIDDYRDWNNAFNNYFHYCPVEVDK